jgi:hypothetical protein
MHLWLLTIATAFAMFLPPLRTEGGTRPRIAIAVQLEFLVVILAYLVSMAVVGGAVLARYLLPAVPLVVILWVSTLWRRVHYWQAVIALVSITFIAAWFVNPPYGFSFEDNLAYRDYIVLHQDAERFLAAEHPAARVLTAWPGSDELTRPYLGYLTRPLPVVRIEDFSLEQIESAAELRPQFDFALVFSTKYAPPQPLMDRWSTWETLKTRFFGFHRDLPPQATAQALGGNVIYSATRKGQWIAIIELQKIIDARFAPRWPANDRSGSSQLPRRRFPDAGVKSPELRASTGLAFRHRNPR